MQRVAGVLQLFASPRSNTINWPEVNTQTSHFMEIQDSKLSPFWAHVQVGQPNELVLDRLGIRALEGAPALTRRTRLVAGHVISTILNVHSSIGPTYEIRFTSRPNSLPMAETRSTFDAKNRNTVLSYSEHLAKALRQATFFKIPLTRQVTSIVPGFHFGASFPMCEVPRKPLDTDVLGRPFGWQHVHVVDTSVLPAIPATTVGLLTMANAHRIAARAVASDHCA